VKSTLYVPAGTVRRELRRAMPGLPKDIYELPKGPERDAAFATIALAERIVAQRKRSTGRL